MLEAPVTVSGREAPSNFVSLFSGAGGLDLGLEQAGWNCRYASDIDAAAVASLEANRGFDLGLGRRAFADSHIEQADIRNLTAATVLAKSGLRKGDISVLAGGGPPVSLGAAQDTNTVLRTLGGGSLKISFDSRADWTCVGLCSKTFEAS